MSQSILVKLGNFGLKNVTLESKGANFLINFKPAEKSAEIKKQYDRIGKEIEFDGYKYSRTIEAEVGEVYLMRVIAYRAQKKVVDRILRNNAALNFQIINQDERKDITVAFRIIKRKRTEL